MTKTPTPTVKKRELTVFDLPTIEPPKFPKQSKRPPSVYQRHGINRTQNSSARLVHPTAQLRLREFTANQMGTTTTGSKHQEIALSRSSTSASGFRQTSTVTSGNKSRTEPTTPVKLTLPTINSRGDPILRRPTVIPSNPVMESGDVFQWIIKGKELKSFSFQGDLRRSRDFYSTHYPLLLRKIKEKSPPNSARVGAVTEEFVRENIRYNSAQRRSMKLREKNRRLDEILKDIEQDGDDMTTELRDDVFNPVFWPWNREKYKLVDV